MMKLKQVVLILVPIFLKTSFIHSQIPVGTWRDHFAYIEVTNIVKAESKIFCSTPSALFIYNPADNSIEKLSRTNGLMDVGVSAIGADQVSSMLIVAYQNANLDIIEGKSIYNLPDIKNKQIQGNKKIYQVVFNSGLAYLACGFGIVVIDPEKPEVTDTYYIGPNASSVEVYSIAFDNVNIYAATESGIYYANKDNPSLADYHQWQKVTQIPNPDGLYNSILNFNGTIYAVNTDTQNNTSEVYKLNVNSWDNFFSEGKKIYRLNTSANKMYIIEDRAVIIFGSNLIEEKRITDYGFAGSEPFDAYSENGNSLYIADKYYGLVINPSGSVYQPAFPNGPFNNHVADIDIQGSKVWVAGGGRSSFWGNLGNFAEAYSFSNEIWNSNILWSSNARDFVKILVNPSNPSQVFASAWGAGLYEFKDFDLVQNFNAQNSTLQSVIPGEDYIRIGGLVMDEFQNLYMTNGGVSAPVSVKMADGNWYSFNYSQISNYEKMGDIIATSGGDKWIQLAGGGGLFAFNDNGTPGDISDDQSRKFFLFDETGQVVTNEVLSLAVDKDNVVWVGTDQGVFTYYNPQNVFGGGNFYADRVKVLAIEVDTVVQYLLAKEKITSIAIDGANRKWFGTESSGAFLMSPDCQNEIFHFTTENSKLISNQVLTIAVDGKTGEVFFGTDKGIVSYKGTSTEGNESFSGAYVYPNPVKHGYTGLITITGLAANVNVKITDISGQIVYETTALGGQATWNGNNFSGKRAQTGVYLVFCTDETGEKKKILKLLFFN